MRGLSSYRHSAVEGARNDEILVMLVEKLLQRIDLADEYMGEGDRGSWVFELHQCRAIIIELRNSLDHSMAPEMTASVDRTYQWILQHLTDAGRDGDRERLAEVRRVVGVVHQTWVEAVRLAREEGLTFSRSVADGG